MVLPLIARAIIQPIAQKVVEGGARKLGLGEDISKAAGALAGGDPLGALQGLAPRLSSAMAPAQALMGRGSEALGRLSSLADTSSQVLANPFKALGDMGIQGMPPPHMDGDDMAAEHKHE